MTALRRHLSPDEILTELDKIVNLTEIRLPTLGIPAVETRYAQLERFIDDLRSSGKPETQVQHLFDRLLEDVLGKTAVPEVNIGVGFVDYVLKDENSQPVLIELKPLFFLDEGVGVLKAIPTKWERHKDQITKYLFKNDYVILTDLRRAYLFNREAIGKYEPFFEESFTDLLRRFRDADNIWDAIKRVEDQGIRPDLDDRFFQDLKRWHENFQEVKMLLPEGKTKRELIVLLLNKVIFIKTLEDYGLIDFRFLTDTYLRFKELWEERDLILFITRFFDEIEVWFGIYYDTELFKERFWNYVDKDPVNVAKFRDTFEAMLGTGRWEREFAQGLAHYNYRHIDEDVFGKAYETFIAEHRKDSGVYYTPRQITIYMAQKLVHDVFTPVINELIAALDKNNPNFEQAEVLMQRLYALRIIDPTSGSGSFLIKVLRQIDSEYQRITDYTAWIENSDPEAIDKQPKVFGETARFRERHNLGNHKRLTLIAQQILRHIFAADIDERALGTAKTNTWKEAVKLRPRIYNWRRFKKSKIDHILPDLELNFVSGDSLADLSIEKQIKIISGEFRNDIVRLQQIRAGYIDNPFEQARIEEAIKIKDSIRERLERELPEIERPVLIALEFFFAYFDSDGNALPEEERGFNGVISNPPWEAVKPIKKEFADKAKWEFDILEFDQWFKNALKTNPIFNEKWMAYENHYETYNVYLKTLYSNQGGGDPNFYKLFIERDLNILRIDGSLSVLVPSGFQTDKESKPLRQLLIEANTLLEISSFENRGYKEIVRGKKIRRKLFPDVDSRNKYSIIRVRHMPNSDPLRKFQARFYMHDPIELETREFLTYDRHRIDTFSPENRSIMEFRTEKDYEFCLRIRSHYKFLYEFEWMLASGEFHMTNDKKYFTKREEVQNKERSGFLPLQEGKMIHQYMIGFEGREARYLLKESEARDRLLKKEFFRLKRDYKVSKVDAPAIVKRLDYEECRLVYRAIGRSTDERTMFAAIIPARTVVGHSMNFLRNLTYRPSNSRLIQVSVPQSEMLVLLTLFNSLVLNYYLRSKVSANLTMNFIYELPIPEIPKTTERKLSTLAAQLLCKKSGAELFAALTEEFKVNTKKEIDPIAIRAQIEAIIANELYGLTRDDWDYLTSTFTQGDSESRQELNAIIVATRELI